MSLKNWLEKKAPLFEKGGKLEALYPLYEATDTFLYSPGTSSPSAPYIRDSVDLKRVMILVVVSLLPCLLFGIYNVGYQEIMSLGGESPSLLTGLLKGAMRVLPIILVSYTFGGLWEVLFAIIRKHEINEGFLVTGLLFPLTLPPTIPLWQVAVGISFGIVIGKEVFGGTGMNFLNPALTGRIFLFFAYPGSMSGDAVWVAGQEAVSRATSLAVSATSTVTELSASLANAGYGWQEMFWGGMPGSIGETSFLACLIGFVILFLTGVGSWRIVVSCFGGGLLTSFLFNVFSTGGASGLMGLHPVQQVMMGGFAFGAIFMATDPVSASATKTGRCIYGFLIGVLAILIRVANPAYPEGMMLAIILMNAFAPLIDHFVIESRIKRRLKYVQK